MNEKIYTIGFTQKTAQGFFELLKDNNVEVVLDIRLNNTSQLAAFAKYPDIKYFLQEICKIAYIHDTKFSPTESELKKYKKKETNWNQYVDEFSQTMNERNINEYIQLNYSIDKKICLLCSESTADQCHRKLVGNKFKEVFSELEIIHL
jgi:uncharacterized protein (DUF488 family)